MIHILDIAIKTCCEAISFPKLVMKLYKPATIMTGIKHSDCIDCKQIVRLRQEAIQSGLKHTIYHTREEHANHFKR